MAIKAPHAHLYTSIKLEAANTKLGAAAARACIRPSTRGLYRHDDDLVIFLLMTFSASGEILFVQKNIALLTRKTDDLERAPVIGVTKDVVTWTAPR